MESPHACNDAGGVRAGVCCEVGARVHVYWPAMDDYYPAKIGRTNTDGSYEVMYDDDVAQAQRMGHTVERYRQNQADAYPDLYTAVELDSLRVRLAPIIDSSKLEQELLTAKPLLVRLKQQHGRVKDRAFAQGLINNDDLPETTYSTVRDRLRRSRSWLPWSSWGIATYGRTPTR
eukprot:COSAG02_NODE_215_length_28614_cov_43.077047_13_plen_175_part_00